MYLRLLSRNQIWKSYCKLSDHIDLTQRDNYENMVNVVVRLVSVWVFASILNVQRRVTTRFMIPCAPGSRFGVTSDKIPSDLLELVDGLHFHTLCEQGADDLQTTLKAVEDQFGAYLHQVKWLNMGGGHHITREDYDVDFADF